MGTFSPLLKSVERLVFWNRDGGVFPALELELLDPEEPLPLPTNLRQINLRQFSKTVTPREWKLDNVSDGGGGKIGSRA